MQASRVLIKLGGAALDTDITLEVVTEAIRRYRQQGSKVILVHGGGPAINNELRKRGIQWTFVGGQRVTTPAMIDVIESTLCGSVNRRLVRHFGTQGLPVVGLSGSDRRTLLCKEASPELGLVGKIEQVNSEWIDGILSMSQSPIPVIAPIGVGIHGECFNINADWAATHLAVALGVDQLVFLTDQPGVLDEEGELIRQLDKQGMLNMIDCKVVSGGMLTKTLAVLHALDNGVRRVRVLKAVDSHKAVTNSELGTQCSLSFQTSIPMKEEAYAAI